MIKTDLQYLWQYVEHWAKVRPDLPALRFNETTHSWKAFNRLSDNLAKVFLEKGIGKNDVIATMLPASSAYVITLIAADKIGAIVCAMDVKYRTADLSMILSHVTPKLILGMKKNNTDTLDPLEMVIEQLGIAERILIERTAIETLPYEGQLHQSGLEPEVLEKYKSSQSLDDGMLIIFTGGTTGVPKAALLSKRNVAGMARAEADYLEILLGDNKAAGRDKILAALPPSHVGGTVEFFGNGIVSGKEIIIHEVWSPLRVLETVVKEKLPWIGGVPTMFALMLLRPEIQNMDLSSLQMVVMSGEKVEKELVQMIQSRICPNILIGYGSTEGGAEVTFTRLDDDVEKIYSGYVGLPLAGMTIKITDNNGNSLPPGEIGEVLTKGDFSIQRYFNMPREDKEGFSEDGFCRTGDLGYLDDTGGLYIKGRIKHIIRVGSYTVMPSEIETIAAQIPGIAMAAAIGVPDTIFGEKVWLVVSPLPGHHLKESDIIDHCCEKLAKFKVPEKVIFWDDLPMTRVGKVNRIQIQNKIAEKLNGEDR